MRHCRQSDVCRQVETHLNSRRKFKLRPTQRLSANFGPLLFLDHGNDVKFGVDSAALPNMDDMAPIFVLRQERRVLVREGADAFPRK